jgi:hypothetical protein
VSSASLRPRARTPVGRGSPDELNWRDWTDHGQNRREAVVLRARQILFERTGSTSAAEGEPRERNGSPDREFGVSAGPASPARADDVPFLIATQAARPPSADGRAAKPPDRQGSFFALAVDPARVAQATWSRL